MPHPKPIRAFDRGLAVLAALNRHGSAGALALARDTGLPRATVYRLLETLLQAGYIARSPSDDRFVLRLKLRTLSDGFADEEWIAAVAAPALFRLTARIGWPCDLATLEGTSMLIRESTHRMARFSIDRGMTGRALPVVASSLGQAWLAFANDAERDTLARLLGTDPAALARRCARIRGQGYAFRAGGQPPWPHTGSVALPILQRGHLLGCIAAIWMARAVTADEGLRLCLGPLRETVAEIEAALPTSAHPAPHSPPAAGSAAAPADDSATIPAGNDPSRPPS